MHVIIVPKLNILTWISAFKYSSENSISFYKGRRAKNCTKSWFINTLIFPFIFIYMNLKYNLTDVDYEKKLVINIKQLFLPGRSGEEGNSEQEQTIEFPNFFLSLSLCL